jgi:tetratricopeptide (TPR) repeat protein
LATLSWVERKFADIFLGGIPKEASVEKAVECFKKAIEINPEVIVHHLELGVTYEKLDQNDLAISEYNKVLELPIYHSEDKVHQAAAEKHLKKLGK